MQLDTTCTTAGRFFTPEQYESVASAIEPISQGEGRRIFSGKDTGSCRRADMACRIGIRKTDAYVRELIDIRCVVERTTVAADVGPAQVINEKEYNVRLTRFSER